MTVVWLFLLPATSSPPHIAPELRSNVSSISSELTTITNRRFGPRLFPNRGREHAQGINACSYTETEATGGGYG